MAKYISDFRAGDTITLKIDFGVGVDITNYKFWFTIREDLDGAIIAQTTTTAGSNINDDPVNGLCYITMPNIETKNIEQGSYYYDVQLAYLDNGSTIVKTLLPPIKDWNDKVKVVPGITKTDII